MRFTLNRRLKAMLAIAVLSCNTKPKLDVEMTAKDLTPPQVVSITPANNATEVLDKPTIVIAFNEEMDSGTLNSSTVTVKTAYGSAGIGSYEYDAGAKALSIRIVQSLYLNTGYTITVTSAVKDSAGNAIAPVTSSFTTDVCPKVRKGKPGFNNIIFAMAKFGCTLFVGGQFTYIGEEFAYGVSLDPLTGKAATGFTYEDINGAVRAAVSDGNGGWYIGGDFTQIGPYVRNHLAHILANGEIAPWNPNASGAVFSLAVSADFTTVYAGGAFTTIGGTTRNHLAAIGADGNLRAWNPDASSTVLALTVSGSTVYAGGAFTTIGGTARNRLAAIGTDGTLQAWNPDASSQVNALAVSGTTVYAGGDFTTIGCSTGCSITGGPYTRIRLAAIDADGTLHSWNPNASSAVVSLAVSGSTVYAGGGFANISGTARNRLAAITADSTCLTAWAGTCLQSWNPNANATVRALAVNGSTVYAGGDFTTIGGTARNRLAAIGTDGNLQIWNPNASNSVRALAVSNDFTTVYAGGAFTTIGGTPRNYLAAIGTDGTVQAWDPNASNIVYALAVSGSTVYAGGFFTTVGGTPRNYLAAIGTDGTLHPWNPDASSTVRALAVSDDFTTVYAGGEFSTIGGTARNFLAAIGTDGTLQAWNPNAGSTVRALAVSGSTVYAGGQFTTIGGTARNYVAAVTADSTCLTAYTAACLQSWDPNANGRVYALAVSGSTVYAGGDFATIGGLPRNYLAAIGTDGTLRPWNPNASSVVWALVVSGLTVYAGGQFTTIGGTARNYLAAIGTDGTLQPWNPDANTFVYALALSSSAVYVGGQFTTIGGTARSRLSSINTDGSVNW